MSTQEFTNRLIGMEKSLNYFAVSLTRDPESAKDLVQETYLKAIQFRDKYTNDDNIKAWLFTILKNTFLNQISRLSSKNTVKDNSDDNYVIKNSGLIEESAESMISAKDIRETISELDDDYRIPFQMFVDGYKYKEIADEMDLPIGTVKSRIFFARRMLMESLKDFR